MKTFFVELGYYTPSNANWSYRVYLVIDNTGARLYSETFGGASRVMRQLEDKGEKVEKLHAGNGSNVVYRWKDIKDLEDVENYTGKNW